MHVLEFARTLTERFTGKVARVSPVIYAPDTGLLGTLLGEIRGLQA